MYQVLSEIPDLNNDVVNNNQAEWTKGEGRDGSADRNSEKDSTNVYNGEATADGDFAGKTTKQTLPQQSESRFSHIKDGLESSVSSDGKERIARIVGEVNSLSDVEKLLLYLKLPTGTTSEDQTRQTPTSFLHSSNRIEQAQAFTWIRSHLEEDAEICVPKHEVFDDYRLYCESHTLKPLCPADFGKVMKCVFPNVKPRRLGQRGQSKYCYSGLRKKLEVQPPSLPELEVSPKRETIEYSEENELSMASRQLVCEWAQKLLGRSFGQLQELAEFLVGNLYVNSKSTAAFTVLAAMQEAGLQNSKVPVCSLFTSSSGGNKHKEMQLQLQRKLAERELIKEQKKKLQQHRSEVEHENEKLRSEGFLTPSPAFPSPIKYAARNITKLLQSPVSHSEQRKIPESPKLLKSPMCFLNTSEAQSLVNQCSISSEGVKQVTFVNTSEAQMLVNQCSISSEGVKQVTFVNISEAQMLVNQCSISSEGVKKVTESPVLFTNSRKGNIGSLSLEKEIAVIPSSNGNRSNSEVTVKSVENHTSSSAGSINISTPVLCENNSSRTASGLHVSKTVFLEAGSKDDGPVSHSVVKQILLNNVKFTFNERNGSDILQNGISNKDQAGTKSVTDASSQNSSSSVRSEKFHIVRKPAVITSGKPFSRNASCSTLAQNGNAMHVDGKRKAVHTSMLNVSLMEGGKTDGSKTGLVTETLTQAPPSCGTLPSAFCSAFVPVTNSRKDLTPDVSPQLNQRLSVSTEESDSEGNQMQIDFGDQYQETGDGEPKMTSNVMSVSEGQMTVTTNGDGPVLSSPQTPKRARSRFAPIRPKVSPIKTISSILKETKGVENQGPAYDSRPVSAILKEKRAKEAQGLLAQIASNVQAVHTGTSPKGSVQMHTEVIKLPLTPSKGLSNIPAEVIKLPLTPNSGTKTSEVFLIVNAPKTGSVHQQQLVSAASIASNAQSKNSTTPQLVSSSSSSSSSLPLRLSSQKDSGGISSSLSTVMSNSELECVLNPDKGSESSRTVSLVNTSLPGSMIFTSASSHMSSGLGSSSTTSVILKSAVSHSIQKGLHSSVDSAATVTSIINTSVPATVFVTSNPMQQGQPHCKPVSFTTSSTSVAVTPALSQSIEHVVNYGSLDNSQLICDKSDSNNEYNEQMIVITSSPDLPIVRDTDILGRKRKSSDQETNNQTFKKLNSSEVRLDDDDVFFSLGSPTSSSSQQTNRPSSFVTSEASFDGLRMLQPVPTSRHQVNHVERRMNNKACTTNTSNSLRPSKKLSAGASNESVQKVGSGRAVGQSVRISGSKLSLESLESDALLDTSPLFVDQDLVTSLGSKSPQTASVGVNAKSLRPSQKQLIHQKMQLDQQMNSFLSKAKNPNVASEMKQFDKAKAKHLLQKILQQSQGGVHLGRNLQRQVRGSSSSNQPPVNLLNLLQSVNSRRQLQKGENVESVDKDHNQNSLDLHSSMIVDGSRPDLCLDHLKKNDYPTTVQSYDAHRESILNSELPSEVADFITEHSQDRMFQMKHPLADIESADFQQMDALSSSQESQLIEPFTVPNPPPLRNKHPDVNLSVKNRLVPMQRSISMPLFVSPVVNLTPQALSKPQDVQSFQTCDGSSVPQSFSVQGASSRHPVRRQRQRSIERLSSETPDAGYHSFDASPVMNLTPSSLLSSDELHVGSSYTLMPESGFVNEVTQSPGQLTSSQSMCSQSASSSVVSQSSISHSPVGNFSSPNAFMPIQGGTVSSSANMNKTHRVTLIKPTVTVACSSPDALNTSVENVSLSSSDRKQAEYSPGGANSEVIYCTATSHSEAPVKRTGVLKQLLGRKDSLPSYEEALHQLNKSQDGQVITTNMKSEHSTEGSSMLTNILSSSFLNGVQDVKPTYSSKQVSQSVVQTSSVNPCGRSSQFPSAVTQPVTSTSNQYPSLFAPPSPYTSSVPPASPRAALISRTLSVPPSSPGAQSASVPASPHGGPPSVLPPASPCGPLSVPPASPHGPRSVPPASPHGPRSVPPPASPHDPHSVPPASPNSMILSPKVYPLGMLSASPQGSSSSYGSRPGSRQGQVFVSGRTSTVPPSSPCGSQMVPSPGSQSLGMQPASPYEATPSAILSYGSQPSLKQTTGRETKRLISRAGLESGSGCDLSKASISSGDPKMTKEFPFSYHLALLREKVLADPDMKPEHLKVNRKPLVKSEISDSTPQAKSATSVVVPMDESSSLIMSCTKLSDVSFVFSNNETNMEVSSADYRLCDDGLGKQPQSSNSVSTHTQSQSAPASSTTVSVQSQPVRNAHVERTNPVGSAPLLAGLLNSHSDEESDKLKIVKSRSGTNYSKSDVPSALLNALGNSRQLKNCDAWGKHKSGDTVSVDLLNAHGNNRQKTSALDIQIPDPGQVLKGIPLNVKCSTSEAHAKNPFIAFDLPNVNYMGRAPNINLASILPQKPVDRKQNANPGNIDFSGIFPANSVPKTHQILNSTAKSKSSSIPFIGSHSEVNPPNVNLSVLLRDHNRHDGMASKISFSNSDLRNLLAGQNSVKTTKDCDCNALFPPNQSVSSCNKSDIIPSTSSQFVFTSAPLRQNSIPVQATASVTSSTVNRKHSSASLKEKNASNWKGTVSHSYNSSVAGESVNSENPLLSNLLSKQTNRLQSSTVYHQHLNTDQNVHVGPENGSDFLSSQSIDDELGCTLDILKKLDGQYFELELDNMQPTLPVHNLMPDNQTVLVTDDSS
ncbi:serine-rich adhesin for platelets-like [Gigantopelta aegis]|uniref:serine-rich adhesin for platelets-like n=1 Tax=Gigantopelta aegis TaxID=1735272 RepID=UPI001B88BC37|nr:serine-rich adhesin for platelets-like [Gigantopelta aegis]